MNLTDKIILFVSCVMAYLCLPGIDWNIVPILIAVTVSCFMSYFDSEKVRMTLAAAFFVLCMALPDLTMFIPLICYDCLLERFQLLCVIGAVPLICFAQSFWQPAAAFILLFIVIGCLFKYRTTEQVRIQADYRRVRDYLKEAELRLEKQNSALLDKQDYEINLATLNERNRIAREIHDNVGHLLSSSILQVGALLALNKGKNKAAAGGLAALNDTLSQAMNNIRTSVHDLYDESIDLRLYIEKLAAKFTFCELDVDYDIKASPRKRLKYAFIAIVSEALCNISKHSNASRAQIVFREHPALYQLIISDNGTVQNFDMDSGIGLKNITDRVRSFHGNINISTDGGFKIFISVPKEELDAGTGGR